MSAILQAVRCGCSQCWTHNTNPRTITTLQSYFRTLISQKPFDQTRWQSTRPEIQRFPSASTENVDADQGSRKTGVTDVKSQHSASWMHKVLFNSYLQQHQPTITVRERVEERALKPILEIAKRVEMTSRSLPISARFLDESLNTDDTNYRTDEVHLVSSQPETVEDDDGGVRYPYKLVTKTEFKDSPDNTSVIDGKSTTKYQSEADKLLKHGISMDDLLFDNMEMSEQDKNVDLENEWTGTPDRRIPSSNIPCGGCGALLHCQDTSVPGYIASEKFKIRDRKEIRGELCLRCSSLRTYNSASSINVSPEDYPRILRTIQNKFAMVLLLVDLTDFPCSIWPGIAEIIGTKRPVFLVGNKVDLIPRDSEKYLNHIEQCLIKAVEDCGVDATNIVHTALISATTGYGVENLITKIFRDWGNSGDIYIMGCTNVGKSSLFNALMQSDMCKVHVIDRIQRATVSQWPGTTLNLLKFPIMADDLWRVAQRHERLKLERDFLKLEEKERALLLKQTKNSEYAVLQGRIGRSFLSKDKDDSAKNPMIVRDVFQVDPNTRYPPTISKPGQWDPSDPQLQGKWCFDTPGAVNDNQILDILTLSELKKTLPVKLIEPRTFFIKEGMTMFLGGIARIDYIEGFKPIRYTVFTSKHVPVTIVLTKDANDVYDEALGSPMFSIPSGSPDRLKDFPKLKSSNFEVTGTGHDCSCCDLVISSAGWVAVSAGIEKHCKITVHTPNGKGIFLRQPALLPYAVNFKGKRIRDTPAYLPHRVVLPNYKGKMY